MDIIRIKKEIVEKIRKEQINAFPKDAIGRAIKNDLKESKYLSISFKENGEIERIEFIDENYYWGEPYKIVREENGYYILSPIKIAVCGGRSNGIIELKENEESILLSSNGSFEQITKDLFVIIDCGNAEVIRGKVKSNFPDTVHGRWKIVPRQTRIIYETFNLPSKYIVYNYTDGSYDGITVLILEKESKKEVYRYEGRYFYLSPEEYFNLPSAPRKEAVPENIANKVISEKRYPKGKRIYYYDFLKEKMQKENVMLLLREREKCDVVYNVVEPYLI